MTKLENEYIGMINFVDGIKKIDGQSYTEN